MSEQAEPTPDAQAVARGDPLDRKTRARMLNYRLVPLWFFLFTFGAILAWEFGVRGMPATAEKIQATMIISLIIAFLIGAPIGIRYFNPLPPKT